MKQNKLTTILAITFIIITIIIITINTTKPDSIKIIKKQQTPQLHHETSINHLKNTCSRNRQCTTPSCSLWTDINHNGQCDRGER